jgi:hypothetical protein
MTGGVGDIVVVRMGAALGVNDGPNVGTTDVSIVGSDDGDTAVIDGFIDGTAEVGGNDVGTTVGGGITGVPVSGTAMGEAVGGESTGTNVGEVVGGDGTTTGADVVGASDVR